MRTIEIVVTPDGQARLETKGFSGSECRIASQILEQALGQRTKEEMTAEFYNTSSEQQALQAGK